MRLPAIIVLSALTASAGDWTNSGGNPGRCGLSDEYGPLEADLLWSGAPSSLISWQPVIEGDRIFVIRQAAWPGTPGDSPVVCMDLDTGEVLWSADIPYEPGDWITWIGGVKNGLVFASRGGNGASVSAPLYALYAEDGGTAWVTAVEIDAGAYDGVVFAPDGDPIVASFEDIWRFDSSDGSLVWHASRTGSVSGQCGGCLHGDAFYVADAVPGGHSIVRYDAVTGVEMYSSPVMPGFTAQCTPMAGPDGIVYFNRSQNNTSTDYFYAFEDTGSALVEKWRIPTVNACAPEFGVGPDGSVYMVTPGPRLSRVDPDDGSIIAQSAVLDGYTAARIAIGADGTVYFSNGGFAGGHFYAFTQNLSLLWDTAVPNINIGGPALGQSGVLVICGVGTDFRAYRDGTGAGGGAAEPEGLIRIYPNPSCGSVIVTVPDEDAAVPLLVFDLSGRLVASLGSGEPSGGLRAFRWDGMDRDGEPVPPGAYIVRAASPGGFSGRIVRL
ncbi:PQQ-binding-like beta-propeller repeat protein [Candidatus Fermentibacteria bacterium]|nr:PQQ-binding-like beta-propeller repeat protein [Candidatus Fermentibacteria bacterium]